MEQPQQNREYVLGTHDEEISRLALQHQVWRRGALDARRRAGLLSGDDPGRRVWAGSVTPDLADIVGPTGRSCRK
jgi:hypothetical protein